MTGHSISSRRTRPRLNSFSAGVATCRSPSRPWRRPSASGCSSRTTARNLPTRSAFPQADIIIPKKPEDAIPELPVNANTFIVIATRGHRYDNVALDAAAATNARYVGLLGSKRKTILIYEDLLRGGMPLERVRDLRAPIGLDVGARTPEEIAVSVMSEILMFRLGGTGQPMKLEEKHLERIMGKIEAEKEAALEPVASAD